MVKVSKSDRDEAIARLREWIKPGDTVYTILDHVSRSGMMRAIRLVVPTIVFRCNACGCGPITPTHDSVDTPCVRESCDGRIRAEVDHLHPNWAAGKALGLSHWRQHGHERDALVVGGCGMDMGFHLVYELGGVLYGDGYQLKQRWL